MNLLRLFFEGMLFSLLTLYIIFFGSFVTSLILAVYVGFTSSWFVLPFILAAIALMVTPTPRLSHKFSLAYILWSIGILIAFSTSSLWIGMLLTILFTFLLVVQFLQTNERKKMRPDLV